MTHGERTVYKPGSAATGGIIPTDILSSDFRSPEPGEIKFLVLKPRVCGTSSLEWSCPMQREMVLSLLYRRAGGMEPRSESKAV